MKYVIKVSYIEILGYIWMPRILCGQKLNITDYDIRNMKNDEGKITREEVEDWLTKNAGDFSEIVDFSASIEDGEESINIEWLDEENYLQYTDCMYGEM